MLGGVKSVNGLFYATGHYRNGILLAPITGEIIAEAIVGDSSENYSHQRLIVELAGKDRLPAVYPGRGFAEKGGLLSYGVDPTDLYRRAAADIAEILRGANPGDIPFYQAQRFELVINLTTAKALGIAMPATLLAGADEVIE